MKSYSEDLMKKAMQKQTKVAIFHKVFPRRKLVRTDDGDYSSKDIDPVPLNKIRSVLLRSGLKPTFSVFEEKVKKQLERFGVALDSSLFRGGETETEIFVGRNILVLIEKIKDYGSQLLQISYFYETDPVFKKTHRLVMAVKNFGKPKEGTYFELAMKEKLDDVLRKDSPNGKIIKDKKLKPIFNLMEDAVKRPLIKQVIKNIGANQISNTREAILKAFEEPSIVSTLLDNTFLFKKKYRLKCEECGWIVADFMLDSVGAVQNVIKKGSFTCTRRKCHSNKVKPVEVFSVQEDAVRCLGGVWLEKYVDALLQKRAKYTWPGKVNGDDELDNVFLFGEKTFLVECKDTSFGMSDLYSLMIKAKGIEADEIVVFTTQGTSANVTARIKELNDNEEYKITLIDGGQPVIAQKINDFLSKKQSEFFDQMLTGNRATRRRLRLPHIVRGL